MCITTLFFFCEFHIDKAEMPLIRIAINSRPLYLKTQSQTTKLEQKANKLHFHSHLKISMFIDQAFRKLHDYCKLRHFNFR